MSRPRGREATVASLNKHKSRNQMSLQNFSVEKIHRGSIEPDSQKPDQQARLLVTMDTPPLHTT